MNILVIDNYDSFVHNLARYLRRLGQATRVVRNDAITLDEVSRLGPDAIILSPGPCTPREAGISLDLVRAFYREIPIFGVCLGHQTIGEAFGGRIIHAPRPVHGQVSLVSHDGIGFLEGIPNPFVACRYHSLVVDAGEIPECLERLAWTDEGMVMALRHREFPVMGVQFHPESILTPCGYDILAGFLRVANLASDGELVLPDGELRVVPSPPAFIPSGPVTF